MQRFEGYQVMAGMAGDEMHSMALYVSGKKVQFQEPRARAWPDYQSIISPNSLQILSSPSPCEGIDFLTWCSGHTAGRLMAEDLGRFHTPHQPTNENCRNLFDMQLHMCALQLGSGTAQQCFQDKEQASRLTSKQESVLVSQKE